MAINTACKLCNRA